MKLKLSKESSLHSSDYFELLNSIDIKSNILGNSKKGITRTQDGIILNPGGYTHTSVSIGDAIAAIKTKVVEVHISNIANREEFRKLSFVSSKCEGTISGLGLNGYELAVLFFLSK
jgi:3-dehydroquinate dehydratase-2